jgi:predicted aspartyl protease
VVVPAFINGHGPYRFLVDTGANHSILSNKIANELKLPVESNKMLSTSGSRVPIKIRLVECLQIGGTPITQTEIATTDWEILRSLHVDGIIGADYLKRFKISIDYGRKLLTIEP